MPRSRCSSTRATGCRSPAPTIWCPVDAQLEHEADLEFETVPLQRIMNQLERTDRTSIVILDACRDNPFLRRVASRSAATRGGLAPLQGGVGTLIAYATAPDTVALDGTGRPQPVHRLAAGAHRDARPRDRPAAEEGARGRHRRHRPGAGAVGSFLAGRRLLFRRSHHAAAPAAPLASAAATGPVTNDEQRFWDGAQSLQSPDSKTRALDAYLATYPEGAFAMLAKLQLDDLRARQAASTVVASTDPSAVPPAETAATSRTSQPTALPTAGARDIEPGGRGRARPAIEPGQAPPGPALADRPGAGAARHGRQLRAEHPRRDPGLPAAQWIAGDRLPRQRLAGAAARRRGQDRGRADAGGPDTAGHPPIGGAQGCRGRQAPAWPPPSRSCAGRRATRAGWSRD